MEDDPQIKILNRTFSNGATLRNTECLHNKKPVTKSRATQAFIIERDDNHTVLHKGFQPLRRN